MTPLLKLVLFMALVTWLCLLGASLIRARAWTPSGMAQAMGNREAMPELSGLAGRADRTAKNSLENLLLFAAIALVAQASAVQSPLILQGAQLFVGARLLFVAVYYLGIPYLRTVVWSASIVGLGMMIWPLF
ncbi:MAPEG family protein [Ideonella sp.]|uniref:MAPEG family protein n=1 Tax=Ideonella sp. TaxID=1929293 RepID=UPI003BB79D59